MPVCKCCYNKVKDDKEYCSPCDDKHKKLRVDLEVSKHEIDTLTKQLAEARAENEALKRVVSSTERWENLDDQLQQARQEAARECLLLFYLALDESISFEETYIKGVKSIKAKFGLEG